MQLIHIDDLLGPKTCFSWMDHKKRYIYVKIPKAGGTSMMEILGLDYPERFFHPLDTEDYFVFTMIRNPIERFFSGFNELCKREYAVTTKSAFYQQKTREDKARALIEELREGLHKSPYHFDTHIRPQKWFLTYEDGQMYRIDKIYLMEKYAEALVDLKERGYVHDNQGLPHLNKSKASKVSKITLGSHYIDLLESIYKDDIELYNTVSSQYTDSTVSFAVQNNSALISETQSERLSMKDPVIPIDQNQRIEYYLRSGEYDTAYKECQLLLKENSKDPELLYHLGRVLLVQNKTSEAPIFLGTAFQLDQSSADIVIHYFMSAESEETQETFAQYLIHHLDEGIALFQSPVTKKYPESVLKNAFEVACAITNVDKDNWKAYWLVALIAEKMNEERFVDWACQKVLSLNKEFWFARELPKHLRGYYAQMDQDKFIETYFSEKKPRNKLFVEVGAFDGKHYSNVRRLVEKYGWKGISVEPVQKNYRKLSQSYLGTDVICVNAAASNHSGTAEMNVSTYPHLPEWGSDVSSLDPAENERWTQKYGAKWEKQIVEVKTLTQILTENNVREVGLLSVDAEGHDLEVLQGLDYSQFRPELIVVEYGDKREEIFEFLASKGYQLEQDNRQDLFMSCKPLCLHDMDRGKHDLSAAGSGSSQIVNENRHAAKICTIEEVRPLINPHLFNIHYLPQQSTVDVQSVSPVQLINARRFDVLAKIIYGKHHYLKLQSDWGRQLYLDHIKAFNNFNESDGMGKDSPQAFVDAFRQLSDSFVSEGFNRRKSLIPVGNDNNIIDGSHRLALSYLLNKDVEVAVFNRATSSYDYEYFLGRGLQSQYADAMAYEYVRIKKNTHIVTVFPSAVGHEQELVDVISQYGQIVYRKNVQLRNNGPHLLVKQMYRGESWLGDWRNLFKGAKNKANQCFRGDGPVRVFLLETDQPQNLRACKEQIRDLYKVENHSVHINDTYEETVRLSQIFFNDNSIHFLNHAELNHFEAFYKLVDEYEKMLDSHKVIKDCFCVDGSASMAIYGIRAARDIDYFHYGYDDVKYHNEAEIGSHNGEIKYHSTTIDDIIFNPMNHFYYEGMKFVTLDILSAMKSKRGEKKDIIDVDLMTPYLQKPNPAVSVANKSAKNKIVGLVAGRNEENMIGQCLQLLSNFTDAIVYLDDCSKDNTLNIVKDVAEQCRVERIITKDHWYRDEPGDRNKMLQAGREIGGTHFLVLDADEAFTSNLLVNDNLKKLLFTLKPGDQVLFNWIALWRSTGQYRNDDSVWTNNYKPFAFCDDGKCSYDSEFIHTPRVPQNLSGRKLKIEGYEYGLLHFQFVNWENLLLKQAWYRCLERIREPQKSAVDINKRYARSKDETGIRLLQANPEWFQHYADFNRDVYNLPDNWRREQIQGWFTEYGADFFNDLDIWDVSQIQEEANLSASDSILVSAIVSTYNSEEFIRGCLQDLVEQTLFQKGQLEIVVVNSASEQNEEAVVKEFQSQYSNIQYIRTPQRETIYAAWNRGIQASRGKYITNANTDDRHAPEMLEKLAIMLDSDPGVALIYSHFYVTEVPNQTWQNKTPCRISQWHPEFTRQELLRACFTGPQPMWRRSLHDEYGWFDDSFKVAGDYEFFTRCSQTHKFKLNKEPMGLYYYNPQSLERSAGTRDNEDAWVKRYYAENWNRIVRRPFVSGSDRSDSQETHRGQNCSIQDAIQTLRSAQQAFLAGNMLTAQRLKKQYYSSMNYNDLPTVCSEHRTANPLFSVIIVTYNRPDDLAECVASLRQQKSDPYEIIVIDNGDADQKAAGVGGDVDVYVDCPINLNPSEARNIGACMAKGEILVFLDDDAIPGENYLGSIRSAFEQYDIVGLRGRIFPKNNAADSSRAIIYDMGDKPLTIASNIEGNNAYRRDAYLAVGGMDAILFGHEGLDLSYRLMNAYDRPSGLMYWPEATIFHDYGDPTKYESKRNRYLKNWQYLTYKYDFNIQPVLDRIKQVPLRKNSSGALLGALPPMHAMTICDQPVSLPACSVPRVSVVMSCYNAAQYLPETLESILAQTLTEWELLVVDDGSTDQTRQILKTYADKDSRIRLWFFDDNQGPYVRRNFAIAQSKAEFISIQDADDIMAPQKLQILCEEITRDSRLGIVGSFYRRFLDTYRGPDFGDSMEKLIAHEDLMQVFPRSWHLCWHGSAIIRKSMFEWVGQYDEQPYGSDTFWLSKAGLFGLLTDKVRFKNLPEYLTFKREHAQSQTGKISPTDPRSRRHKLQRYYTAKLQQIAQTAQANPSMDVSAALKQCTCTDFIPRFGQLFDQWESAPVDSNMIQMLLQRGLAEFTEHKFASALITLNYLVQISEQAGQRLQNIDYARGLAYYGLGDDENAIRYLRREVESNGHRDAGEFLNTCLSKVGEAVDASSRKNNIESFMAQRKNQKAQTSNRPISTIQVSGAEKCRMQTAGIA